MKSRSLLLAALIASFSAGSLAQEPPKMATATQKQPGAVSGGKAIELQGKVLAIDKANREVTVKGGSGVESTLYVGPDVKNFDRLKVGDIVTLSYVAALGLELKKNGKALRERVESEQKDGLQGKQPGMMSGKTVKIIADVMAVNFEQGTVTLRGPLRTVDLALQDPSLLKEVKVGDQIEVSYMEATVISAKSGKPAKPGAAK
jgi:predicted lipoprotein